MIDRLRGDVVSIETIAPLRPGRRSVGLDAIPLRLGKLAGGCATG